MIQRIQTIWLFLASAVIFALFLFPYFQFIDASGLGHALKVNGAFGTENGQPTRTETFWLQMIATVLIGLFPLYIIFQFKNRKLQRNLIWVEILAIILLGVWFNFNATAALNEYALTFSANNLGVGFFMLPIAIILLFMASAAIKKDEKLIKSADRLR
ncbi:MAG TPA: DUF4293 domain-containing protein [Sphingobacteriaceae bacterium]|nr:DUF4293 domain-containing protein [Sphingobacteriaceae bacterium]